MNFHILVNERINRKAWAEFVWNHPQGNIFQTPDMARFYQSLDKYTPLTLACMNEREEVAGLVTSVTQKEYNGILGRLTSRAVVWGGPLILGDDPGVLDFLLTRYTRMEKTAIYTQIRNLSDCSTLKDGFEKKGFVYEDHLDILFDLEKSPEALWKEIHPTRRKQIERGYRRGAEFSVLENADRETLGKCHSLIETVYQRAGLPYPAPDFFSRAFRILKKAIRAFVVRHEGEIIGCRFVLCYKQMIYDWYAGSDPAHHDKYPNDILPWEVIRWGSTHGFRIFDFGGAGKPGEPYGVRDYKKKFGGEIVSFGRFQKNHKPCLNRAARIGFRAWRYWKKKS